MEERGILIDHAYTTEALNYERRELDKAAKDFEADTGRAYKDSSKLFAEIFTQRGEWFPKTDKGNPSFAAEFLDDLDSPTAGLIKKYRDHEKRMGTYYSSFLYFADHKNRIHPNMRQAGTTTGRFSYSNPNLQNVPRDEQISGGADQPIVRRSFIPSPDHFLVSIDYDQQEYRMLFDYAGETKIISRVLEGEDVHQVTADMLGIKRTPAKTLNFALLYGAGSTKMAKMLGISVEEAIDKRRMYFDRLPAVKRFLKYVPQVGVARGFVTNWLGRRCYLQDSTFAYKLPNHLIQGGCADVIKVAMVQLDYHLNKLKSGMILQVHDELLFEVHKDEVGIIGELKEIMEAVYPSLNGMKLTASIAHSDKSWAKADLVEGSPC